MIPPSLPHLNRAQQLIRKTWFYFNLIAFIFLVLSFLVSAGLMLTNHEIPLESDRDLLFACVYQVLILIAFVAQFYCIYKKPGTRLLTFLIAIKIPNLVFQALVLGGLLLLLNLPPVVNLSMLLLFSFHLFSLWLLWKMRFINKKWQFQLQSYQGYEQALLDLEQAPSKKALEQTYARLCEQWPAFVAVLKPAYKERRKELAASELS